MMMKATGFTVFVAVMFVLGGCAIHEQYLFDNTKPGFSRKQLDKDFRACNPNNPNYPRQLRRSALIYCMGLKGYTEVTPVKENSKKFDQLLREINVKNLPYSSPLAMEFVRHHAILRGNSGDTKINVEIDHKSIMADPNTLWVYFKGKFRSETMKHPPSGNDFVSTNERPLEGGFYRATGVMFFRDADAHGSFDQKYFRINVARDNEGRGWVGNIGGGGFEDYSEITLVGNEKTNYLPAITNESAFNFAKDNIDGKDTKGRIYWLTAAKKLGKKDSIDFFIARAYENDGIYSPQSYVHALKYYLDYLEEVKDDVRAQVALARMYKEGLGTKKNPREADRFGKLAYKTNKGAADFCAAPKTVAAIRSIIDQAYNQQRVAGRIVTAFIGISMDPGSYRIIKIHPVNLISLNRTFDCQVEAARIDPKIDASTMPHYVYVSTNQWGQESYYGDNSLDRAVASVGAGILQYVLENTHMQENIHVKPKGDNNYLVYSNMGLFALKSFEVEWRQ